jgi:hypothetical protein
MYDSKPAPGIGARGGRNVNRGEGQISSRLQEIDDEGLPCCDELEDGSNR